MYERDLLSIVSPFYAEFSALLGTKRGTNKTYKNFVFRFCASVFKCSSHATIIALSDSILVLMLHYYADVSDSQRVPNLSAAAPSASRGFDFK